jgi:hypothetical protein
MVGRPLIRSRAKVNNIEVQDIMVGDEGSKTLLIVVFYSIRMFFFHSTKSSTSA